MAHCSSQFSWLKIANLSRFEGFTLWSAAAYGAAYCTYDNISEQSPNDSKLDQLQRRGGF